MSARPVGFVLSSKSDGDFLFMRSDAEKTNKAAIKAKKKAEKDEAKAAAKAAKAAKNKDSDDGGGAAAEAPKGPLTPAQKLQSQADGVKKLSKQASQLGAHAAAGALEKRDATVQCATDLFLKNALPGLRPDSHVSMTLCPLACLLRDWVQGCAGTAGCELVKDLSKK